MCSWRTEFPMGRQTVRSRTFVHVLLPIFLLLCASLARAQGPAPETAPPLFPGGALISYNSIFTTRGLMSNPSETIPATARPTFSHEGDFNFTWGFRPNFDFTVIVPVVTNHSNARWNASCRWNWIGRHAAARQISVLPSRFAARDNAGVGHRRAKDTDRRDGSVGQSGKALARHYAVWLRLDGFLRRCELDIHRAFQSSAAGCGRGFSLCDSFGGDVKDPARQLGRVAILAFLSAVRVEGRNPRMVHRARDHLAAFAGQLGSREPRKRRRWRCASCGDHHVCGSSLRACTFGWVWIGMLHIRRARCSCRCAATSVSGSRGGFDFMFSGNNQEARWKCESSRY